jgi:uncharacterized protein YjbI with pentapeptide repeats
MIYKLYMAGIGQISINAATTIGLDSQMSFIFDPANTDYANFKKEVLEGAELQDADGVVMSADVAKEFVRGLP